MSAYTMQEAFASAEAQYRSKVMAHTWGHLAPSKGRTYRGHIIFAIGCFGSDNLNPMPLTCEFKGLDSSPWFYDSLIQFLQELDKSDCEGTVWRFDGTFRNYEFKGSIQQLQLVRAGQ